MDTPKRGDVILYVNNHPSHSWQNGLKVVLSYNKAKDELRLAKLLDDGSFNMASLSVTSFKNNHFIKPTNLTYKLER